MANEGETVDGALNTTLQPYVTSTSAIWYFDFSSTRQFTPNDLIPEIGNAGLQQYDFTDGGIGCHHWT